MPSSSAAFAQKQPPGVFERQQLPLVSLITFEPMGNPLLRASEAQRRHFFETLAKSAIRSRKDGKQQQSASSQVMVEKPNTAQPGSPRVSSPLFSAVYWSALPAFRHAQESMATVINEYARGDGEKAREAVWELERRLKAADFQVDDLMAALLMVIEDRIWEGKASAPSAQMGEPGAYAARVPQGLAGPSRASVQQEKAASQAIIPEILKQEIRQSAQMRLASVREMLRYYFAKNPREYHRALCKVIEVGEDVQENSDYFQERLADQLARIGSFALAQMMLAEIKARHDMDTQDCLLKLGYKYDGKLKRLILGKRTCGTASESKSILQTLLSSFRGKRLARFDKKPPKYGALSARPRKPAAPG